MDDQTSNATVIAKQHIDSISAQYRGILENSTAQSIIDSALQFFGEDIYSTAAHFLLELIQNADDNEYAANITPALVLTYRNRVLRTDCNELGFTPGQVEAICNLGYSTKKDKVEATGEKGVGFKSVFSVAASVWIASGPYTFKFDASNQMGMLIPIWESPPDATRYANTSMYARFAPRADERIVFHDLDVVGAKILTFLRKLRELNLHIELQSGDRICYNVARQDTTSPDGLCMTQLTFTGEMFPVAQRKTYVVCRYEVKEMPQERKRPGRQTTELRIAFPVDDFGQPVLESQDVYAVLPVRSYGFTVGSLISSYIDYMLTWTSSFFKVTSYYLQAGRRFHHQENGIVKHCIPSQLAKERVLLCEGIGENGQDLLALPGSLRYIPREFRDSNGYPLTLCPTTRDRYLSVRYLHEDWSYIQRLGVKQMTVNEFMDDLGHLVNNHGVQDRPDQWHESLAKTVNQLLGNSENRRFLEVLRKLAVLPLRDNKWVSSADRVVFLPLVPASVPSGLKICEIDPAAVNGGMKSERARFFEHAGAQGYNPAIVCDLIVERQTARSRGWQNSQVYQRRLAASRVPELANQLYFLFKNKWTGDGERSLWVLNERSEPCPASIVYIPSKEPDSAAALLHGKSPKIELLHKDYLGVGGGDRFDFMEWLRSTFGIWRIPRLATPGNALSPDFQHLIDNSTSSTSWLLLLNKHFDQYSDWLVPGGWKSAKVSSSLRTTMVDCLHGERYLLEETCRPGLEKLLPRKALLLDPEFDNWKLLSHLGVMVGMDLKFYFSRLAELKETEASLEQISQIYTDIEAKSQDSSGLIRLVQSTCRWRFISDKYPRSTFTNDALICVPNPRSKNGFSWLQPNDCIWKGPKSLKHTPKLQELYPDNEVLFKKILKLRNAGAELLLKEIEEFKPENPTHILEVLQDANVLLKDTDPFSLALIQRMKILQSDQKQTSKSVADRTWLVYLKQELPPEVETITIEGGISTDDIASVYRQVIYVAQEIYDLNIPKPERKESYGVSKRPPLVEELSIPIRQTDYSPPREGVQLSLPHADKNVPSQAILKQRRRNEVLFHAEQKQGNQTPQLLKPRANGQMSSPAVSRDRKGATVIQIPGFPQHLLRDFLHNRVRRKDPVAPARIVFLTGDEDRLDSHDGLCIGHRIKTHPGRVHIDEGTGVKTVFMAVPDPIRQEEMFSGELVVSRILQEALGNDYIPDKHWTSSWRSRVGYGTYERPEGSRVPHTAFAIPNSSLFTDFLVNHGCGQAKWWKGKSVTYYLDVQVTSGDLQTSFRIHQKNFETARQTALEGAECHTVYALMRLYNIYTEPEIAIFVNLWKLYTTGNLNVSVTGDHYVAKLTGAQTDTPSLSLSSFQPTGHYKFHALESLRHIRVLRLCGQENDLVLRGDILHVSLDESPSFIALSYTWGSALKPFSMRTPEGDIPLTASLYYALSRIHQTDGSINIWADGISINQSDATEKSQQISLLPTIYRQATQVYGWVGDGANDSSLALKSLQDIHASPLMVSRLGKRAWAAIIELFARAWFVRAWIIQEVILARDLHIVCGSEKLPWEKLYSAVQTCEKYAETSVKNLKIPATRNLQPILSLGETRKKYHENQKRELLDLFELFQHAKSTLKRDKLFTLLNIAADAEGFRTDYRNPLEIVMCSYASVFVARGKALELLSRARGVSSSRRFPSWIPDWTTNRYPKTTCSWPSDRAFDAGGGGIARIRVDPENQAVLEVAGSIIDTIVKVGSRPSTIDKAMEYMSEVLEFIDSSKSDFPNDDEMEDLEFTIPIGDAAHGPWGDRQGLKRSFQLLGQTLNRTKAPQSPVLVNVDTLREDLWLYCLTAVQFSERFGSAVVCQTARGYLGLVPAGAKAGDSLALISGGKVPFCLRHELEDYQVVGEAYIHGVMHGEAFKPEDVKTLRLS
ncbi:hypothetical protein M747DRAFT_317364 [Aspergillus niger ATCC 13496]|uniref:Contig An12c0160, genomic contig n=3 Tax=Aspergillus niger TaxID=5061 RepID=A2QZM4_ASPNC|nr:uncharacterized protein An12g05450 [Aspergillus niger]RDH17051.1 hypothetical protein M747DRAFT_317364 [Aspergillus niger ATCC 13496]CAK46256.1 unnamed protein product [Aspergillus niger]